MKKATFYQKIYLPHSYLEKKKKTIPCSIQKNPTQPPFFFFLFFYLQIQSLKIPYPYPMVTYINNSIQNKNHPYRMKKNAEKNITKKKKKKKPSSVQNLKKKSEKEI